MADSSKEWKIKMVFESLTNPLKAEKKPWRMFFIGAMYSSVALILSLFIFKEYASLVMIFLTVLASVPLMYNTIKIEEKKDIEFEDELFLIKEHGKALSFFMFLFFGFVLSFALWYILLPQDITATLYETQLNEIEDITNSGVTGNAVSFVKVFSTIFFNNLLVMVFALLFAFFYGVGAIFILTWNASIIGAAIGRFASSIGSSYFAALPMGMARYLLHGIPEMAAYFMAGLAGGIISVAVIRHDVGSEKFRHILTDSLDMVFLAVFVLFVAALIEVFVTPMFF
jgi:uncharacterized membrane protein SpoIIM required for sporulation